MSLGSFECVLGSFLFFSGLTFGALASLLGDLVSSCELLGLFLESLNLILGCLGDLKYILLVTRLA